MELADRGHGASSAGDDEDKESARVLSHSHSWDTYFDARLITQQDAQLIRRYDKRDPQVQAGYLQQVSKEARIASPGDDSV